MSQGDEANLQSDTPRRVPREDGSPRAGPGADENSRDIYTPTSAGSPITEN
jgi:hypothetical protein